ncbi:hypothetical protein Cgig2_032246 [Carnegiea gigantea]|uniref:FAR1-related sequence 11-like HTH-like domain-containing protein n=1 Tax=Carnegiea gigantea TaxID=171969 RepID=A0A9Q1Q810_9CARY|nr:hypothetical protein Cgig2_032246 [Carnegiea gigantea]
MASGRGCLGSVEASVCITKASAGLGGALRCLLSEGRGPTGPCSADHSTSDQILTRSTSFSIHKCRFTTQKGRIVIHEIFIITMRDMQMKRWSTCRRTNAIENHCEEDEKKILLLKEVGLFIKQITVVLELEKQLKHGDLPFFKKGVHNLLKKICQDNMESNAMDLLEQCKHVEEEDSRFQYAFFVDE